MNYAWWFHESYSEKCVFFYTIILYRSLYKKFDEIIKMRSGGRKSYILIWWFLLCANAFARHAQLMRKRNSLKTALCNPFNYYNETLNPSLRVAIIIFIDVLIHSTGLWSPLPPPCPCLVGPVSNSRVRAFGDGWDGYK